MVLRFKVLFSEPEIRKVNSILFGYSQRPCQLECCSAWLSLYDFLLSKGLLVQLTSHRRTSLLIRACLSVHHRFASCSQYMVNACNRVPNGKIVSLPYNSHNETRIQQTNAGLISLGLLPLKVIDEYFTRFIRLSTIIFIILEPFPMLRLETSYFCSLCMNISYSQNCHLQRSGARISIFSGKTVSFTVCFFQIQANATVPLNRLS